MRIEKKIWPKFFAQVARGEKRFELRLGDFACAPGDTLVLREWDPKTKAYTGRAIEKEVGDVLRTKGQPFWTEDEVAEHGFQMIAFK